MDDRCQALTLALVRCRRKATAEFEGTPMCMQHARSARRWTGRG